MIVLGSINKGYIHGNVNQSYLFFSSNWALLAMRLSSSFLISLLLLSILSCFLLRVSSIFSADYLDSLSYLVYLGEYLWK